MLKRIETIAEMFPMRVAYTINNQEISYKDLWDAALENAINLRKQGADPVLLYGHKSVSMIISILSCLIANRAYIPIEVGTPSMRIIKIIEESKASLLIANEEIEVEEITCLRLEELERFSSKIEKDSDNDIAYIMFTSGSTGNPKGVPISRGNLSHFVQWISNFYPLSEFENIKVLNQTSFSFDLSITDIFYSLYNGHTLVGLYQDRLGNYQALFSYIKDKGINMMVCTPTFMKLCLLNNDFRKDNFPALRCIYFCGELLEVKVVQKLFQQFSDIFIVNAYGPTEATSAVSGVVITKEMTNKERLPIGDISTFACELKIEEEEIVLQGKSVFKGYLGYKNRSEAYYTGDIGYIEDDLLYWKGRKDHQIKYKGYRIELEEIEHLIKKIEGVIDGVVIAKYLEDQSIVKMIKAFVVIDDTITEEDIRKELRDSLPAYMLPGLIKSIKQLPVNKNGKVDRKALAQDD